MAAAKAVHWEAATLVVPQEGRCGEQQAAMVVVTWEAAAEEAPTGQEVGHSRYCWPL
jgi:hypothetical protein